MGIARRHARVLRRLFEHPIPANVRWSEVEAMLLALGAEVSEGRGSRVRVVLNGVRAVFHRPHPGDEMNKGSVRSLRRYLVSGGIRPRN